MATQERRPNRLAREKSPYLLQHAHNPVDWYPWGDEAFDRARRENKPIFLSVGYSTCHWCHVMERESFESEVIARIMNEQFVPIKVDREERPDVDRVYMTFVQATTGSGGWPMSVFLTPELKPFFGGTYFPPESHYGRPGFRDILQQLGKMWQTDAGTVTTKANDVMEILQRHSAVAGNPQPIGRPHLDKAFKYFLNSFDRKMGGFDGAPKFPRPSVFNFLLRYYQRSERKEALDMTVHTLRKMARGGIYDHLGGGFHRYSVDDEWHVPHFEKMLYDQAQLVVSYLEAFQITGAPELAAVARDVLDYVLRDMTHPEGGFYSAEDADSVIDPARPDEKGEGAFYVWTYEEIKDVLDPAAASVVSTYYGVEPHGNVYSDPHGEFVNQNILHVQMDHDVLAHKTGRSMEDVARILAESRTRLLEVRSRRPRPHLDDKVLTAWNGLMVAGFARAFQVLEEPRYLEAANRAADFILSHLWDAGSRELKRRFRDGEVAVEAKLDDYAFFLQGLLDLYDASLDPARVEQALALQRRQIELFWDASGGGFLDTSGRDPSILLRAREDYDGAEPAPSSIAILNLLRLAEMTDNAEWRSMAGRAVELFADRTPPAIPQMLVAADFLQSHPVQVVVAGSQDVDGTRAMLREIRRRFLPRRILLEAEGMQKHLPLLKEMTPRDGRATAYVCQNYACQQPTTDVETLVRILQEARRDA